MNEKTLRNFLDCVVREEIDKTNCAIVVISKSKKDGICVHCASNDEAEVLEMLIAGLDIAKGLEESRKRDKGGKKQNYQS